MQSHHYFISTLTPIKRMSPVAQWPECQPTNQRVAGSISSQGTCLGCWPGRSPVGGAGEATTHWCFSLSLSLSPPSLLPLSLKINKISSWLVQLSGLSGGLWSKEGETKQDTNTLLGKRVSLLKKTLNTIIVQQIYCRHYLIISILQIKTQRNRKVMWCAQGLS